MSNRVIAWGLIVTIVGSFCIGIMDGVGAMSYATSEGLTLIFGFAMIFFGVSAIIRLFKTK